MADDFEPYHVPQQTRRDKLRINNSQSHDFSALFDQSFNLGPNTNPVDGFKEEGMMNFMGFLGGVNMISSSSSSTQPTNHLMYLNPQDVNNDNPFVYTSPHSYRAVVDQSFHGSESLALSLSSSHNTHQSNNPLELNLQRYDYDSPMFNSSGNNRVSEVSRSTVPLGPFTGYATVLSGSRFLKPAHQLLKEICDVGRGVYGENVTKESSLLDSPTSESFNGDGIVEESLSFGDVCEKSKKKSRLLSLLDEVYKRYKLYYQQIQAIVASFESVAGLSNAAPFTNLALQALSKHFKCLKNAITDQLQFTTKSRGNVDFERNETQKLKNSGHGPYVQKPFRRTGFVDQPVWRPQRGLPEQAVTVLRAWLFEHFLHPYPTDTDKLMLANQAGLSRNQVSNWFINARVRIWKPMVEEIHMLETRQNQNDTQREEPPENTLNNHLSTSSSFDCENASTSIQRIEEFTLKRSREDLTTTTRGRPMNLQYDNLSHHPQSGVGVSNVGGVSLTLGLPQNGMGLSESYPILAARRLGLDAHGEGSYVLNGFAPQNQQFGRDIVG